jgi:hypothetical protein
LKKLSEYSQPSQCRPKSFDGQPDNIAVAALNPFDDAFAVLLDRIGAGLVRRIGKIGVGFDFLADAFDPEPHRKSNTGSLLRKKPGFSLCW